MSKNDEINKLMKFVAQNCAEADSAENEVGEVINTVTQIEVVNRLYVQYSKYI